MGDYKWIGLIRKFYNCSFYNDSNAVQMFLHIFLNAQREDKPYFDQITMRGQFRTSIKDIMQFLQISRKAARRSLDKLKAAGIIHVVSLRRNGVLITVREFSKFLALEHVRGGWVKLYYDLDYQDFFENAKVLHIYLHILLHSYSDSESYEDPLWFDFKKISASTGISPEDIKDCLLKLRKVGILNVGYNGQKRLSTVQLIEFSDYARNAVQVTSSPPSVSFATPAVSSSKTEIILSSGACSSAEGGGIKAVHKEVKEGPKDVQKISSQNVHKTSTKEFANNYKPCTYIHRGQKEGQKGNQKSSKIKAAKALPNSQGGGYVREPISIENRDKRTESIYYNNYSHERKFSSVEKLVLDEEWVCSMQELYGFSGKETLYAALTLFLANLKCRKEEIPEWQNEFLDYFCNWYKRNERNLRPKLKAHSSPNEYGKTLWSKCLDAFAKIVSDQAFASVFKPLTFESFDSVGRILTIRLPDKRIFHTLENDYIDTLKIVFDKFFGEGIRLQYRCVPV